MVDWLPNLEGHEQLTALDADFIYIESARTPMHIGAIAIYDPSSAPGERLDFEEMLGFVRGRLHLAKTFRKKLAMVPLGLDHPYWIDDEAFELEHHIRHLSLPAPGDWRQLCLLAARLHARRLNMDKPLWEFTVVEGLDNVPGVPAGSYAVISKIHHCAVDGVSGVEIAEAVHTLGPSDPPPPEQPWAPARAPSGLELVAKAQLHNLAQPLRTLDIVRHAAPGAAKMLRKVVLGDLRWNQIAAPHTRFNNTISGSRVVDGRRFDLTEIKRIRKAWVENATVNDVVLTICGGALRKYLEAKEELPEDPLVAFAPISVRAEEQKKDLGNKISGMTVEIGTHIADPLDRLVYVKDAARNSKSFTNTLGAREMAELSELPPALLTRLAAQLYTNLGVANRLDPIMFNTIITNVPGPPFPLYSAGARLVAEYGLAPIYDGMGLIHTVLSYCGDITITFNACRDMIPDPEFYADCLEASFKELRDATLRYEVKEIPAAEAKAACATGKPRRKVVKRKSGPVVRRFLEAPLGEPDDLTRIKGVGPAMAGKLNGLGVYHFAQIAEFTPEDVSVIEESVASKGRLRRESWIAQAFDLAQARAAATNGSA